MRHSVAGMLAAMGMNHFLVMDYIGDSSSEVIKHYAALAMRHKNDVESWGKKDFYLRRAVSNEEDLVECMHDHG